MLTLVIIVTVLATGLDLWTTEQALKVCGTQDLAPWMCGGTTARAVVGFGALVVAWFWFGTYTHEEQLIMWGVVAVVHLAASAWNWRLAR